MLENKNFIRVISLIIAVMLWVFVMGEVNPETEDKISDIEVTFVNANNLADKGLAVVVDKNVMVDAVIKGPRSVVNGTKNTGISATVDVGSCSRGNNVEKIEFNLPEDITLESVSRESISFKVDKIEEKEVPVKIEFVGASEGSDSVPWAYNIEPEEMTVKGAKTSVETIEAVKGTITGNVVSGSEKNVEVELIPVNKGGEEVKGIVLETSKAEATIRLMKSKDVTLNIKPENLKRGFEVEAIEGIDSIKIVGASELVKDINELDAYVDLSNEEGDCEKEIGIDLPKGIYLYDPEHNNKVNVRIKAAE